MGAILGLLIGPITQVLTKLIPDANARAAAQEEITKALISKESEVNKAIADAAKAQAEVNLAEAQSPSIFVSGWRPFIGWVCGLGFAYSFIFQPLISNILVAIGHQALPSLDTGQLMTLALGMLGLGGMRTAEKYKGVDRQNMGKVIK